MKVKELIKKLETMDQSLEITIPTREEGISPVMEVKTTFVVDYPDQEWYYQRYFYGKYLEEPESQSTTPVVVIK